MQTASFYHMLSVIYLLIIARTIVLVQIDFLFQFVLNHDMLLFTPFSVTRFAMHRIYANRINSRGMSRVFCDLRSQKTPRGILPVNSNEIIFVHSTWVFGNFIQISVPHPSSLCNITLPFNVPTACFTIESPSPVPPISLEWLLSTL